MGLQTKSQSSSISLGYITLSVQIVAHRFTLDQTMIQTMFEFDLEALMMR